MIKILLWIVAIVAAAYVGVVGWRIYQFYFPVGGFQPACPQETKTCEDGTIVGRVGTTCELADCPEPKKISEDEARGIAEKDCVKKGETVGDGEYDEDTKNWRFVVVLKEKRKGCVSDCLVREESGNTKIDWRCEGNNYPTSPTK